MMINILDTDLTFEGQDVYIVGSGPNGKGFHQAMPSKSIVIALNKAIEALPVFSGWLWLVAAPGALRERWFHEWMLNDDHEWASYMPLLLKGPLTEAYPENDYYFDGGPHLTDHRYPFGVIDGYLRGSANSCGRALQLAFQKKAKRCVLIGVDMEGDGYFDGTRNEDKRSIHPDGLWTQKAMLQRLVDWLRAEGMDIVSLTKTRLDVEMI